MVTVAYEERFKKIVTKVKDASVQQKIKKQIKKIINNPEIGKPMKVSRKGTREFYIPPFRLSYLYVDKEDKIVFLDLYHKDFQ
jgi:mRNA-degrading endonuclease RelE of RelBE toxin-antitoxin system